MNSHIDRAAKALWDDHNDDDDPDKTPWEQLRKAIKDRWKLAPAVLDREGLLVPDPQIIRTPAELEALDPDTLVLDSAGYTVRYGSNLSRWDLPLALIREGAEVRACREALGEATP